MPRFALSPFARLRALALLPLTLICAAAAGVTHAAPHQAPAAAQGAKALPSFGLIDLAGGALQSESLVLPNQWLIAYVAPECVPCTPVLEGLATMRAGVDVTKVTVIVRGDVARAQQVRAKYPALALARWYADPDRAGSKALRLAGIPALVGWRNGEEAWRAQGGADEARARSLAESWLVSQ